MNKIKRVSKFCRIIFQIIFIVMPLLMIYAWMTNPESVVVMNGFVFNGSYIPASYRATADHPSLIMHALSFSNRMYGLLVSSIPMVIELFITYALIKLFRLYETGEIFSINNVRNIRNIGYGLLALEIVNPLYQLLMGVVLTKDNPVGHRFCGITLDQTNFSSILIALIIILISWVMAEGCKLREEQQLTI